MLELKGLGFSYGVGRKAFPVFRGVDLSIADNEFFCVIGPSGCGKTTLLNIVAGFETPTEGSVTENGVPVQGVSHERAMVFQDDAVFPWLTVYQNVEYGPKVRGVPKSRREREVPTFISLVGLSGFENLLPKELSGGMKKRVDLARALANGPRILLMDEPFGALDAMTKEMLQVELTTLWERDKKTVLFITHDVEEALFLADRVAIMAPLGAGGDFELFEVPFERPRNVRLKEDPAFQRMRRELVTRFEHFEAEVSSESAPVGGSGK